MALFAILLILPEQAQGQQPQADSAWAAGDFTTAAREYARVLQNNPRSAHANYRLAILTSWSGNLDSALVLIRQARNSDPADSDIRIAEARILAWATRYDDALSRYDSLLAERPDNTDAALGRALTLAWANRLRAADSAYAAILARDPGNVEAAAGQAQVAAWDGRTDQAIQDYQAILARNPEQPDALVGLGQVYFSQGQVSVARQYTVRAIAADQHNRSARNLELSLDAASVPQPELTLGWSNDSDHNTNWWQTLATSIFLSDGIHAFGSIGALEASDRTFSGTRLLAEIGIGYGMKRLRLTGALGARRISSDTGHTRTEATYRISAGYQLTPALGVSAGFAHYPFDETALLLSRNLNIDALEAGVSYTVHPGLELSGGTGRTYFSDTNVRTHGFLGLTQTIRRDFFAGVLGRVLAYHFKGLGYFSPDRFIVAELRGGYARTIQPWSARLTGGLGLQQVGSSGKSQSEWHVEGRFGRHWSRLNQVEVFAGISNSAESSTTGAFRYRTAGVVVRIGLK